MYADGVDQVKVVVHIQCLRIFGGFDSISCDGTAKQTVRSEDEEQKQQGHHIHVPLINATEIEKNILESPDK